MDEGPRHIDRSEREYAAARERQSYVRHELRAPLAVLYPLVSLLREGEQDEARTERIAMLERTVERLEAQLASVAESGFFDCAAAAPRPEPLAPADLAAALRAMPPAPLAAGFAVDLPDDVPPLLGDREDALRLLTALLDNAGRYSPAPARVVLGASRARDGGVALTVRDEGDGIGADELPLVTGFGYRGEAARARAHRGLGLGLWVASRLAERNGGGLRVASALGGGTTVTVTLPAAPAS